MNKGNFLNRLSTSYRQVVNKTPTPKCPHFSICSGCEILLDQLPSVWDSVLAFFRSHSIEPDLWQGSPLKWRLKAKLPIRVASGQLVIGLFKKGTHEAVSIPSCLVHHPSINRAVETLLQAIREENVSIYDEKSQRGHLRYAQMVVSKETGLVQLGLVVHAPSLTEDVQRLCKRLQKDLWHSIWVNFHPEANNRVLGDSWQHVSGDSWLYQPFLGEKIPFHPGAFSQANLELFEDLVQKIQSWTLPEDRVVELFAGVGVIGASLPRCKSVLLVENNPFAELSFKERFGNKTPAKYQLQDASEFSDFSEFDLVIVDPPRKGLGAKLLQSLSRAQKLRLIYVSCGWKSFQTDANALLASGWNLKKAEGFYLFPGTDHIEVLALFEKD